MYAKQVVKLKQEIKHGQKANGAPLNSIVQWRETKEQETNRLPTTLNLLFWEKRDQIMANHTAFND
jgi:hypothetical protein